MRWLVVLSLLILGAGAGLANAGGYRNYAFYSPSYCQPYYYRPYYPTYSYAPAYMAPKYVAPAAPVYNIDWKTEAIKYAEKKDDYALFQRTMQALGVNYANGSGYAHSEAYPGQANSLYGYSYQTIKEAYGSLDMNQLFQTQARLAAGTKEAMAEANAAFASNVGASGDAQARVAEILAKGQSAAVALQASNAQGSAKQTTTTTVIQPNVQASAAVSDPSMAEFMRTIAVPACASCHSASTPGGPKASLDINQYPSFNQQQKNIILERLLWDDPKTMDKRMPRLSDGKPGKLSAEGIRGFATH